MSARHRVAVRRTYFCVSLLAGRTQKGVPISARRVNIDLWTSGCRGAAWCVPVSARESDTDRRKRWCVFTQRRRGPSHVSRLPRTRFCAPISGQGSRAARYVPVSAYERVAAAYPFLRGAPQCVTSKGWESRAGVPVSASEVEPRKSLR